MELNLFAWIVVVVSSCTAGYFYLARIIEKQTVKDFILRNQFFFHPNAICYERVYIAWIGLWLYYFGYVYVGIFLFTSSAFLDAVDGLVARACNLVTEMGKWFDPLCDKATYLPALVIFASKGILDWRIVGLIIVIEAFGQFGVRYFLMKLGWSGAANNWGKMKTMLYFSLITCCALVDGGLSIGVNLNALLLACLGLSIASIVFKFIPAWIYADMLSMLNLACGLTGIILIFLNGTFIQVVLAVIVGQIFDLLDGKCAKKYGGTRYGENLDTIADSVSFGVCPMIWYWAHGAPISGTIFGIAIGYRLYRYMRDKKTGESCELFTGLPSPGGAMLAFGIWPVLYWSTELLTMALLLVSYLTVSKIKLSHLGRVVFKHIPKPIFIAMGAVMIMCLVYVIGQQKQVYLGWFLLVSTTLYMVLAKIFKPE